jgi:hypothetical protein
MSFSGIRIGSILTRNTLIYEAISYTLKLTSYRLNPSHVMSAEISRSSISILENIILSLTDLVSKKRDEKYNYGYGKLKSMIAFLPGVWYLTFGAWHFVIPILTGPNLHFTGSFVKEGLAVMTSALAIELLKLDKTIQILKQNSYFKQRVRLVLDLISDKRRLDWISEHEIKKALRSSIALSVPLATSCKRYHSDLLRVGLYVRRLSRTGFEWLYADVGIIQVPRTQHHSAPYERADWLWTGSQGLFKNEGQDGENSWS